jgi:hypothetical protein
VPPTVAVAIHFFCVVRLSSLDGGAKQEQQQEQQFHRPKVNQPSNSPVVLERNFL